MQFRSVYFEGGRRCESHLHDTIKGAYEYINFFSPSWVKPDMIEFVDDIGRVKYTLRETAIESLQMHEFWENSPKAEPLADLLQADYKPQNLHYNKGVDPVNPAAAERRLQRAKNFYPFD